MIQRHRQAVEAYEFPGQEVMPRERITISAGVTTFPGDARETLELINHADQALYAAKSQGGNMALAAQARALAPSPLGLPG